MKSAPSANARVSKAHIKWLGHIAAQQASGKTQTAYCLDLQLSPKSFSLWKRRLYDEPNAPPVSPDTPVLVPVTVTPPQELAHHKPTSGSVELYSIRASLPNGVVVDCAASSARALGPLFAQLAQLPC